MAGKANGETSGESSATAPKRRRRVWRWILAVVATPIVLVVAVIAALLWVPGLAPKVAGQALTRWDSKMPGSVEWRDISGSLAGGIVVEDLVLRDASGHPLLRAEQLRLDLDASALLGVEAALEASHIRGLVVDIDGEWSDLAPPATPDDDQDEGGEPGPNLPIALAVDLTIEDARVERSGELLVALRQLQLIAEGQGRSAEADLAFLAVDLAQAELRAERLQLSASWDAGVAALERLELDTAFARVRSIDRGHYDVTTGRGELTLAVESEGAQLGERFAVDQLAQLGHLGAELRARIDADALELLASAEAGVGVQLNAGAEVRGFSVPRGSAWLELEGLGLTLDAWAQADVATGLDLRAWLRSPALDQPLAAIARTLAAPELTTMSGELDTLARCVVPPAPGEPGFVLAELHCSGDLSVEQLRRGTQRLAALELKLELEPLAATPTVAASAQLHGLDLGGLRIDDGHVSVAGSFSELELRATADGPRETLEFAADYSRDGDRHQVDLAQLRLTSTRTATPLKLALAHPARVVADPQRVDIQDLTVLERAGARLWVDGHLGLAGEASSLDARLTRVDLERVHALVGGPPLAGRVDLRASFAGSFTAPELNVAATAEELELAGLALGKLELASRLATQANRARAVAPATHAGLADALAGAGARRTTGPALAVWLRSRGPAAARIELATVLPLRLEPSPDLRRSAPLELHLAAEDISLVSLGGWMPATPEGWRQVPADAAAPEGSPRLIPEGRVDLDLALAGSLRRPWARLAVDGKDLVLDRLELGDTSLRADYDEQRLKAQLRSGLAITELELAAELPLRVDLAAGRVALAEDLHALDIKLDPVDLAELRQVVGPKLPALDRALAAAALAGELSATLTSRGPLSEPELVATVRAVELERHDLPIGEVELALLHGPLHTRTQLAVDGPLAARLELSTELPMKLRPLANDGPVQVDGNAPLRARVRVDELALAGLVPHIGSLPVDGRLDLDARLTGDLSAPQLIVDARLDDPHLHPNASLGALEIHAELRSDALDLQADLLRAGIHHLSASAHVPLTVELDGLTRGQAPRLAWHRDGHHSLLTTASIDGGLLSALLGRELAIDSPDPDIGRRALTSELALELRGGGTLRDFALSGHLEGELRADGMPALDLRAQLELDDHRQRAELRLAPSSCEAFDASVQLEAVVTELVSGQSRLRDVPFELEIHAPDFDLDTLAPLLPPSVAAPDGTLTAEVRGDGPLHAPELAGALEIREGELTVVPLRQRFDAIELNLAFDTSRAELRELELNAGGGHLRASGSAEIERQRGVEAALEVEIRELPIVRPGLPAMAIDTDLDLELDVDKQRTLLTARLHDPEVRVAGANADPPKSIPSNANVIFATDPGAIGEATAATSPSPPPAPAFDLRIELADPLLIGGPSIDMAWSGDLNVEQQGSGLSTQGELSAQRGRIDLLGQSFELRRGIVTLPNDGSLDPFLDIEVQSVTPDATVVATISGRVSQPQLHFSSTPPMSEYEIVSMLVTGSSQAGEAEEGEVQAKAASLLAAVGNPALQNQLYDRLGIDRAQLGFGEGVDQPILTVGKRVTRDVYVETTYHHNAPEEENTAEVRVEYDFARRWSLETYFGDAAVGGIGVYWTRSFAGPPWSSDERAARADPDGEQQP